VQKHKLIAFRRIAAKVYKKNLKWKKAVNMATKDGLFVDAMETASQSGSPELVKDLLAFFVEVCMLARMHSMQCLCRRGRMWPEAR
jgi:clathrin heavy chain